MIKIKRALIKKNNKIKSGIVEQDIIAKNNNRINKIFFLFKKKKIVD